MVEISRLIRFKFPITRMRPENISRKCSERSYELCKAD